jgi:hypothetical protein
MDTTTLKQILKQEVAKYAGEASNGIAYFTMSEDELTYAIVGVSFQNGKKYTDIYLLARLVGNIIEIEYDANSKPLDEALIAIGVPSTQITYKNHVALAHEESA